jgi:hypothetical protein
MRLDSGGHRPYNACKKRTKFIIAIQVTCGPVDSASVHATN